MMVFLIPNNLEIDEMGKKIVTIFIRKGAKVGDRRKIWHRPSNDFVEGTVIEDLTDTVPEQRTFNDKPIKPAERYYRVKLDQ